MGSVLLQTSLPGLPLYARGKVRDIYDLGDKLLFVTTDRISAFDVVLPNGIPYKGAVLTQLSAFWFRQTENIVPNHLITTDVREFPSALRPFSDQLRGRSMLVRKAQRIDVECVVRGYLSGSGWAEYRRQGTICGQRLPEGLMESEELPQPIFTPATKARTGHDENITLAAFEGLVGPKLAPQLIELSLAVYRYAAGLARKRGIIIADTKFEFGLLGDQVILIDELLTPDSSRFWQADGYRPGGPQPSFDKQFARDWLTQSGWNKEPPAPQLPDDVVAKTSEKYREAYRRLTGQELATDCAG